MPIITIEISLLTEQKQQLKGSVYSVLADFVEERILGENFPAFPVLAILEAPVPEVEDGALDVAEGQALARLLELEQKSLVVGVDVARRAEEHLADGTSIHAYVDGSLADAISAAIDPAR